MIPIFVPYIEEKNNDIFFKKVYDAKKTITAKDVTQIIEENLEKSKEDEDKEVVFYGEDFTKLNLEKQEELLSIAHQYLKEKKINNIRIVTEPKSIDKRNVKILKKYKVGVVELDTASTNNYILKNSKIKYKYEDIIKASKLIRRVRIKLHFNMMIGMPESTKLDELNSAKELIKLKPKLVKIYPVIVLKQTKLEKKLVANEYEPLTIVQAIERCKELTYLFSKKKIKVIECLVEDISNDENIRDDVIEGPYNIEFRNLVESSIWCDSIVQKIKKFNVKVKEVEVRVNPINYENAVGYKSENIEKLEELYNVDAKIIKDDEIKPGKLEVIIKKKYTDFLDEK